MLFVVVCATRRYPRHSPLEITRGPRREKTVDTAARNCHRRCHAITMKRLGDPRWTLASALGADPRWNQLRDV